MAWLKTFLVKQKETPGIKDHNGQLLYGEEEVANGWKEFFEKPYGDETMNEATQENEEQIDDDIIDNYIVRKEFGKAVRELLRKEPLDEMNYQRMC